MIHFICLLEGKTNFTDRNVPSGIQKKYQNRSEEEWRQKAQTSKIHIERELK